MAQRATRRNLSASCAAKDSGSLRGSYDDASTAQGRTIHATAIQLLPSFRHHVPFKPAALVCGQEQDGLPQLVHLLPAMSEDRRLLLPIPGSRLEKLLARLLDGEAVSGGRISVRMRRLAGSARYISIGRVCSLVI